MLMLLNSSFFYISPSHPLPNLADKIRLNSVTPCISNTGDRRTRGWVPRTVFRASSPENPAVAVALSPTSADGHDEEEDVTESAADVVRNFYAGINAHDLTSVEDLIAENCVYEDLIFPRPFVGSKEILQFFKKFIDYVSIDLQFVIDDLSTKDSSAVGVTWHLEWKKKPFPFSKGCSFYRLEIKNQKRQIIYGRDSVEPAIKPGETALMWRDLLGKTGMGKMAYTIDVFAVSNSMIGVNIRHCFSNICNTCGFGKLAIK